ncbi:hypothetical protein DAPPUDRAFT_264761 [Daphnia pulex]|uniref:Uncharacterized protein n=1 Tax=Daphnia pulex TaxID=6669 RepID=E9HSA1_DAPPU|nr:hypothetical protein DAPPUDRAFT_264761 [Daphnia pulex]|eukprot:EFX65381.1 hypothetical protein DAPPUDRAFT_264761 [Daphnia pulex]
MPKADELAQNFLLLSPRNPMPWAFRINRPYLPKPKPPEFTGSQPYQHPPTAFPLPVSLTSTKDFDRVLGKTGPIALLPKIGSSYRIPISGVVGQIDVNSEGHGVWCQDDGHQGQVANVDMFREICQGCKENGPLIKSATGKWLQETVVNNAP